MCTTRRVAAASRPRHKPSRAGGGADWRIPLRIGPALDRRRVLAGSGTRHRRGGAARGFFSGTGQVCATRRVAAASRPRHQPSRAGGGADWRIPLRTWPALDRRRVLAGSGARHRRGGAARGFIPRRQYLGGLASPRSLSPEASSSMGGSTESGPIPSGGGGGGGGGSDASLGRSRAAGGEAAGGTRAEALWIRGC